MLAMVVTVPILIYQIAIGALIIGAGAMFGPRGAKWGAVIAVVWTLTHVIFPPLMCLQLVTITAATAVSFALARRRSRSLAAERGTATDTEAVQEDRVETQAGEQRPGTEPADGTDP